MKDFSRLVAPIARRVQMMVGRAVIAAVDDGQLAQALQLDVLEGETHEGVEHFQGYGLTSNPPVGLEAVVSFVGGLRSHGIVVGVADRKYRLKGLQSGAVALYDDLGQKVLLDRDGVKVTTDQDITIEGDTVTVTANHAIVDAARVDLGGEGGMGVARIGDLVEGGVITGGSAVAFAV